MARVWSAAVDRRATAAALTSLATIAASLSVVRAVWRPALIRNPVPSLRRRRRRQFYRWRRSSVRAQGVASAAVTACACAIGRRVSWARSTALPCAGLCPRSTCVCACVVLKAARDEYAALIRCSCLRSLRGGVECADALLDTAVSRVRSQRRLQRSAVSCSTQLCSTCPLPSWPPSRSTRWYVSLRGVQLASLVAVLCRCPEYERGCAWLLTTVCVR